MKKKIFMSMVIVVAMCFSVSAIDVYNNSFNAIGRPTTGNGAIVANTVTGGWWYVSAGGWAAAGGLGLGFTPGLDDSRAAYVGWLTVGNDDIRQDIPGPTIAGTGATCPNYSTENFVSGTTYTITYSYKGQGANAGIVSNQCFVKSRDKGMGAYNITLVDFSTEPIANAAQFKSISADFTAVGRTNRFVLRGVGPTGEAILLDNVTIEEASEKNWSFEFGSFHGWEAEGLCWNGGPFSGKSDIANNRNGTYVVTSFMGGEPQIGTLKSKNFTLPVGGYVQFLQGGWSTGTGGTPPNVKNYVILCDAETGAQIGDKSWCPNATGPMSTKTITPPVAYQGTGSNVYIKVVDDCSDTGWAWMSFDNLEIKIDPNRTWNTSAGNWSTAGNWDGGVPNASDAIANFNNDTAGDVNVDMAVTVLNINAANVNHDLTGSGHLTVLGTIDVDSSVGSDWTINSTLLANNGITKAGAGTLVIATATNNYLGGDVDIDVGTLSIATPLAGVNKQLNVDGGSTLNVSSTLSIDDWGQLRVGYFETGTATVNINDGGKVQCYTLRMGQATSGTGILNINSGGELVAANVDLEGNAPADGKINIDGGTLSDSAVSYANTNWIHSMSGVTLEIMSGGATFNVDNQYREVNHVITGTSSGNLIKEGSETLALEVAPTFDGNINVNAGELRANCDISGLACEINVAGGATIGGSGTLPAMTVPSGATISPGNSIGTLSIGGDLTLSGGCVYNWEVDLNSADLLSVGGTLIIGGAMNVNVIDAGSPDGTVLTLASATTISGNANDITLTYGPGVGGPTNPTDDGSGNLTAMIIPEPGIIGLLSLLGLAILRRK